MAEILQFRPRLTVFAPEQTLAMGDAYDKAIAALPSSDSARRGDCDPEHLCSSALSGFRKPRTAA